MSIADLTLSDWSNLATIVGSVAVIGVFVQAIILYYQFKADHERGRREKTVDLLTEWFSRQKKEGPIARKITETFTESQCRDVLNQKSVSVPIKIENLLTQLFELKNLSKDDAGKEIILTDAQSAELRWQVVSYLNSLEMILIAWQYSIIERPIIEIQFSYLFKPTEGHEILKNFRTAAGSENTYPAIEIFVTHLQAKRREILIQKSAVA